MLPLFMLAMLLLAGCQKSGSPLAVGPSNTSNTGTELARTNTATNTGTELAQNQTIPSEQVSSKTPVSTPWYFERLERLGFYVFPTPEQLPPFNVTTMDGQTTGVELFNGKVTMLNFWATWCPPCRVEMPGMQVLYNKTRDVAFDIMAVSVGEQKKTVTDFIAQNKYSYPVFLDESGVQSAPFTSRGIPTTFILDKQGKVIAGLVGSRSYDGPEVVALFRELAERLP
jgi:thiol-disulfide isomerase/thioredoxin